MTPDRRELLADDLRRLAGLAEAAVGEAQLLGVRSPKTSPAALRPGGAGSGSWRRATGGSSRLRRAGSGATARPRFAQQHETDLR
jgi:hypothetical protein